MTSIRPTFTMFLCLFLGAWAKWDAPVILIVALALAALIHVTCLLEDLVRQQREAKK